MHCIKRVTNDLAWVGVNDRRLAMFEGVYSVPYGVSYNSYLLTDEKTVLFDTVDKAVRERFLENIDEALKGRELDYLVIQHMEPDHSSAVQDIINLYPNVKIICNEKTLKLLNQFFDFIQENRIKLVNENDTLNTGKHLLQFIMAPMVHWPEVMVTYDSADKILFSADGFGCFGALNVAIFADEVDFEKDYMDEARRYYSNIVGKYGVQVEKLLSKASALTIEMICPLHGFVWRKDLKNILSKYALWGSYEPEDSGVMIAYASVYGHTENAAEILACSLRNKGIKTQMFDVSSIPASEIISAAFKWSHLVFASTTYNAGIFVTMEALISDLVSHNIQNRTVAVIENGSWAAQSGRLIRSHLEKCKNMRFIENTVSIKSSLKKNQSEEIESMVKAIAADFNLPADALTQKNSPQTSAPSGIDKNSMFKLSYGLFALSARDGDKDNVCIINTVTQITESPLRISIAVNKANYTHDMILKTSVFNISVLAESAPFSIFERFGFHSGRDSDKFKDCSYNERAANGIRYITEHTNAVISAKVIQAQDYNTHTLFIAEVTQAFSASNEPSATYQYYFEHIKPKPQAAKTDKSKKGFVCKICGYVHEGDQLPDDFVCPLCKHGASDFEPL